MKEALRVTMFALLAACLSFAQGNPSQPQFAHNAAGRIMVSEYGKWSLQSGNSVAVGAATITLSPTCYIKVGTGNRQVFPLALNVPVTVVDGASTENVTITAVSAPAANTASTINPFACSFTATFANAHNAGVSIISNDGGLEEAINDAIALGSGIVSLDSTAGVSLAQMNAALVYPTVTIEDLRTPQIQYWVPTPAAATRLSAPSALAAGTVASSTTVAGNASYTGGTVHVCYALVDIMGNEGPCSADFSFADTSAKAIVFNAPPAATGAVGYIPYIGLESGSSANEYQMPLYTQPAAVGAQPVSNGVCTLTTLETTTPACALTNATYGQTGVAATVTAYPLVTSPQAVGTGGLSTASFYIGNTNSRTVYNYQPAATPPIAGVVKSSGVFNITTAAASTVPQVLGTVAIPPGFMNYVGRSIRVCGEAYSSTQGASSVVAIKFEWDAIGSDVTTGLPVILGGPLVTNTLTTGTVASFAFCQDLTTTVAAATATGGSILPGYGYLIESALSTGATPAAGPSNLSTASAIGSLNLAGPARLHVIMVQTTSSTAVPQLLNLTVQVLN